VCDVKVIQCVDSMKKKWARVLQFIGRKNYI
jgi:hypothetical protein